MKSLKIILLYVILFVVSVLLTLAYFYYIEKNSLSILKHNYSKQSFNVFPITEIIAGEKISGEFRAKEDNLGIIEVRFNTYNRISTDSTIFRLKEKGGNEWYYEQVYEAKQFGGYSHFPFGFSIIPNSKDKDYYFELESLHGNSKNSIGISTEEPLIIVKHKFNADQLFSDKQSLIMFIIKKSKNIILGLDAFKILTSIYILLVLLFNLLKFFSRLETSKIKRSIKTISKKEKKKIFKSCTLLNRIVQFALRVIMVGLVVTMIRNLLAIFEFIFLFIAKGLLLFRQWLGEK